MPRGNRILIRSGTSAPSAGDFATNEPAFDRSSGKLYIKNAAGTMVEVGGGGGGNTNSGSTATAGAGGASGGGAGGDAGTSAAGEANAGGGGGGGTAQSAMPRTGGNGGSGIVVLRVPPALAFTVSAGLTFSSTLSGADRVLSFTAGTGTITFS